MSKLNKFRRTPTRFFADSKSALVRALGELSGPVLADERFNQLTLDPVRALAALPIVGPFAQRVEAELANRRRALIGRHGTPLVSVVMAAYNSAATIEDALASVCAQTHERLEIIVIDDGSTDATARLADSTADPRIVVRVLEHNVGAALARNIGLKVADGEFVTFHDSDDRSHPERIERQLAAVLRRAGGVMSVCNSYREDEQHRRLSVNGRPVEKATISMLFRRALVLDHVGYMRAMPVSEDAEYYERIKAAFGDDAEVVLQNQLLAQRFRADSLLFADGQTELESGEILHKRSDEAERQWALALARIERIRRGDESPYVAPGGC